MTKARVSETPMSIVSNRWVKRITYRWGDSVREYTVSAEDNTVEIQGSNMDVTFPLGVAVSIARAILDLAKRMEVAP